MLMPLFVQPFILTMLWMLVKAFWKIYLLIFFYFNINQTIMFCLYIIVTDSNNVDNLRWDIFYPSLFVICLYFIDFRLLC